MANEVVVYSFLTTRAGGTSSTLATGMAAAMADKGHTVMLVDMDMEGGTIVASLGLGQSRDRGIQNVLNTTMSADALMAQSIAVPGHQNLQVIPGLRGGVFGPELSGPLRSIERGLRGLPVEYVIMDCGHPLSHAGIRSPQEVLGAMGLASDRIFVVVRDEPAWMAHALDVFKPINMEPGHWGEMNLIICEQRKGRIRDQVRQEYRRRLPDLELLAGWTWNEHQAARASDHSSPYPVGDLPRKLGLIP